jgi:hypothetical protein
MLALHPHSRRIRDNRGLGLGYYMGHHRGQHRASPGSAVLIAGTYTAVAGIFFGLFLVALGEMGSSRGWHLPGRVRPTPHPPGAPYHDKTDFVSARRALAAADRHGRLLQSREASADQILAWQRATLHLVAEVVGNPVKEELRSGEFFRDQP